MHVLILSHNRFLYSTRRLVKEFERCDVRVSVVDPRACMIETSPEVRVGFEGHPIGGVDLVVARLSKRSSDAGLRILENFGKLGVTTVNTPDAIRTSDDKSLCHVTLSQAGIATPRTCLVQNVGDLVGALDVLSAPVVLKTLIGSQGVGVMLAESSASARSMCDVLFERGEPVLVQEYLGDQCEEVRAMVVGGKIVAAVRRDRAEGEFRANFHQGAKLEAATLSKPLEDLVLKASGALGLEVSGVDIISRGDDHYVLDVNASPGFEGIDEALGVNLATPIVERCVRLMK